MCIAGTEHCGPQAAAATYLHIFSRGAPLMRAAAVVLPWVRIRVGQALSRWASLHICATCRGDQQQLVCLAVEVISAAPVPVLARSLPQPVPPLFFDRVDLGPPNIVAELASGQPKSLMLMLSPEPDCTKLWQPESKQTLLRMCHLHNCPAEIQPANPGVEPWLGVPVQGQALPFHFPLLPQQARLACTHQCA